MLLPLSVQQRRRVVQQFPNHRHGLRRHFPFGLRAFRRRVAGRAAASSEFSRDPIGHGVSELGPYPNHGVLRRGVRARRQRESAHQSGEGVGGIGRVGSLGVLEEVGDLLRLRRQRVVVLMLLVVTAVRIPASNCRR